MRHVLEYIEAFDQIKPYVKECSDDLSKLADGDLSSTVNGGENRLDGLANKLVDLRNSAVQDVVDVVNDRREGVRGAVVSSNLLCWMNEKRVRQHKKKSTYGAERLMV